jgi:hypothetical protein
MKELLGMVHHTYDPTTQEGEFKASLSYTVRSCLKKETE